ncbi:hypothetical protein KFE80_09930 [bacterium SCSIO 12696]|nr:hypothetical protein KFE80_09930 [bacterium SCSIO 12696]
MKIRVTLLSVLLVFVGNMALAAGWSGGANIQEIYPSPGNNGVFIKHGSMPNPDNCPSPGYYLLPKDNPLFSEIYALLMSAQARQATINIQIVSCGGENNLYPLIYQVIAN